MDELAMLADILQTNYDEEVTRQLHVMAQGRESSPIIDRFSNQLRYATILLEVYLSLYNTTKELISSIQ